MRHLAGIITVLALLGYIAAAAPTLEPIDEQTAPEGLYFGSLVLPDYVHDPEFSFTDLEWTIEGGDLISLVVAGERLFASTRDAEWSGSETLSIQVCNPNGECAVQEVTYTVTAVNDAPVLLLSSQVVDASDAFTPISLTSVVTDVDHALGDLVWELPATEAFQFEIDGDDLLIELRDDEWTGVEIVTIGVCDPDGACSAQTIQVVRSNPQLLSITRTSSSGVLLQAASLTVAIDALTRYDTRPQTIELLESATPPYRPDVLLVTHSHYDHFSAEVAAAHLLANPDAVLVGPQDVVDEIRALAAQVPDRQLHGLSLDVGGSSTLAFESIEVVAFDFPHSPDRATLNYGYLVRMAGYSILHTGDLMLEGWDDITAHPAVGQEIDVALLNSNLLPSPAARPFVETLQSTWVVRVHDRSASLATPCTQVLASYDNARCFRHAEDTLYFDHDTTE